MAFNNGAKLSMWSFEDKDGKYGVANLTYRRKGKEGFVIYGYKYCKIYDLAYQELKDVQIPEGGHVDILVAKDTYTRTNGDKSFDQNPIEVDARWDAEKGKQVFEVKIYKASVVKVSEKADKQTKTIPEPVEESNPFTENVTDAQTVSQPTTNGLVGLDFLNIPDTMDAQLPFK